MGFCIHNQQKIASFLIRIAPKVVEFLFGREKCFVLLLISHLF